MWTNTGKHRPAFAQTPTPDQESVWDYPRPPALVACERHVSVLIDGISLAATSASLRLLETSSPPTFYIPPGDVNLQLLAASKHRSFCEWKGRASYWALAAEPNAPVVGWSYAEPLPPYQALQHYLAFYPGEYNAMSTSNA